MMKKWLQDMFTKKESLENEEWRTEDSIFKFLVSNLDSDGELTEKAYNLPDEKKDDDQIKFAPGLIDAMFGTDDSEDSKKRIKELHQLLKKIATKGDRSCEPVFYRLVTENEGVIGMIDEFLQSITNDSLPIEPYLFTFAKDLATKTEKRNAVKFGIALLGLCQNKSVVTDIKILGLHDEFTVYSTIAIMNLSADPVTDLWELAKKVNGWGRIQLVDRLANMELNQQIKDWLVLEGYKNSIMYEYLALTCAATGQLHEKLEYEQIDHKLFKSSSEIIEALIVEHSPSGDITSYMYAASVIENFVRHATQHAKDISDFNTLNKIKNFLTDLQKDIGEQERNGWNQDVISNCLIEIVVIINSKDWKSLALDGLKSKDNVIYWNAKRAAESLGIDLWETVWNKLKENPLDYSSWYDATHYSKPNHADLIIDFALEHLPLEEFASGPQDLLGLGSDYAKFMCLDTVIIYLEEYPKKGEKIILTGLQSPVTRNRNMAIQVLDKWKRENWSAEIEKAINQLKAIEPNDKTRESIERLINGYSLK